MKTCKSSCGLFPMANNVISTTFPAICRLLTKSPLEADIDWALELAKSRQAVDELKLAFNDRMFHLNDLMRALSCGTILPHDSPLGPELERNVATIINAVGFDKVRSAYRGKLLINSRDKFEDVRYEIAVAAKACSLFDAGSVDLEVGIDGTDNDSDVRGVYERVPIRLEVTVLHDSLSPAVDERLEEVVRTANLPSGFIVGIRRLIASQEQANRIRAIIELLHERHASTSGADETVDGLRFEWRRGSYKCEQADSPIRSVEFDLPEDVKEIERPVLTRSATPQYMTDDFERPERVVTIADLPHDSATHQEIPLSSTIHKKIAVKLKQCEDGVVNVVVLGKPLPMGDNAVEDALYGASEVFVPFTEDERGLRHFGNAITSRDAKAPFVLAHVCPDPAQFVDAFRKISAVWLLRLDGGYGVSRCLPNPNANNPIPRGFAENATQERSL